MRESGKFIRDVRLSISVLLSMEPLYEVFADGKKVLLDTVSYWLFFRCGFIGPKKADREWENCKIKFSRIMTKITEEWKCWKGK